MKKSLTQLETEKQAKVNQYEENINILLKEVAKSKEIYNNKCPREEEVNEIERLKNKLHILEKHIQQLRKEFKQVREELIINDDAITQKENPITKLIGVHLLQSFVSTFA